MTAKLDQFLEPGEQVVWRLPKCREPHNLYRNLSLLAIFLALAFGTGVVEIDLDGGNGVTLIAFLPVFLIHIVSDFSKIRSIEAAITERRVLQVDASTDTPECTAIDLADVALVEVLLRAVHITKQDGDNVWLYLPEQASRLGRALARATGLSKPKLPGQKVEFAETFTIFVGTVVFGTFLVLTLQGLPSAKLVPIPLPLYLIGIGLIFYFSLLSYYAGELLALVALRRFLNPEDFGKFVRCNFSAAADSPTRKRRSSWCAALYLHLFKLASGIPADPNQRGETPS